MKKILLFLAVILLIIPIAAASYLSMQSSIAVTGDEAIITVTNLGDEIAYSVQLSVDINGQEKISDLKSQLGMQEKFEWKMPLGARLKNPGKYPLVLTTNYQDANSYPFSAISVSTFDYKQSAIPDIAAKIGNIKLSGKGVLELTVKNMAERAKGLNIRLIAPKELTAGKDKVSIKLPAKTEMSINFEIEKFSALAGSSYAVFAVIEYDENGRHYTAVSNGMVKVVQGGIFSLQKLAVFAMIAIIVVLFAYFMMFRKRKNRKER